MMGFGFLGLLLLILFFIVLGVAAVWLVGLVFSNKSKITLTPSGSGMTARQILDQRYARGEITREEYDLMKKDLQ